jgi:hypothetical protein
LVLGLEGLSVTRVTGEPSAATVVLLISTVLPADFAFVRPSVFAGGSKGICF